MSHNRPVGVHVYQVNCHEFGSIYRSWRETQPAQGYALGVRTLGFERIWLTAKEIEQVVAATSPNARRSRSTELQEQSDDKQGVQ